jgi:parvulin-like peptidyl-prolyl isomerase
MSHRRRHTLPKRSATGGPASQRRISRREREERQRRQLYIGLAIAAVISVVIVGGFAINEYFLKPRAVLASVNGVEIRRRDYWKVRSVDLVNQVNQYNQFAQLVDPTQQQQYLTLAQQAADELDDVWGSTSIDDATLTRMVDDQVYLQSLDDMGLSISGQDVQNYLHTQFQPSDAPIFSPTPTPTLIPQRAEWATQTEIALVAEETEQPGTPEASPVAGDGTPVGSPAVASPIVGSPTMEASPMTEASPTAGTPTAGSGGSPLAFASPQGSTTAAASPEISPTVAASPAGSPAVTGSASAAASPVASPAIDATPVGSPAAGSPVASPIAQATATATPAEATPNPTEAIETAEANYDSYRDAVFGIAHLSRSDYVDLVVRPAVAREKVDAVLLKDVGQTAEQVHAAHILVDTNDLAVAIYADLQAGADFEETAREQSNDTGTAENGGDLGWFTRGQMVKEFEDVAYALQPGEISEPVKTEFGWHIITVYEKDPDRAMTDQQIQQYRDSIVARWLEARKAEMDISSDVEPTPTPATSNFVPPPDAPPLPTPTPPADGSPVDAAATPVGSPVGSPVASPVASPAASPESSPAP